MSLIDATSQAFKPKAVNFIVNFKIESIPNPGAMSLKKAQTDTICGETLSHLEPVVYTFQKLVLSYLNNTTNIELK